MYYTINHNRIHITTFSHSEETLRRKGFNPGRKKRECKVTLSLFMAGNHNRFILNP